MSLLVHAAGCGSCHTPARRGRRLSPRCRGRRDRPVRCACFGCALVSLVFLEESLSGGRRPRGSYFCYVLLIGLHAGWFVCGWNVGWVGCL